MQTKSDPRENRYTSIEIKGGEGGEFQHYLTNIAKENRREETKNSKIKFLR